MRSACVRVPRVVCGAAADRRSATRHERVFRRFFVALLRLQIHGRELRIYYVIVNKGFFAHRRGRARLSHIQ